MQSPEKPIWYLLRGGSITQKLFLANCFIFSFSTQKRSMHSIWIPIKLALYNLRFPHNIRAGLRTRVQHHKQAIKELLLFVFFSFSNQRGEKCLTRDRLPLAYVHFTVCTDNRKPSINEIGENSLEKEGEPIAFCELIESILLALVFRCEIETVLSIYTRCLFSFRCCFSNE